MKEQQWKDFLWRDGLPWILTFWNICCKPWILSQHLWQWISPECFKLQLHFRLVSWMFASSIREEWWHLHWEDCQHSIVTAFSAVCENTLSDVCTCCNSICGKAAWQAGQLEHLRNYFHSLPHHRWQTWRWTMMMQMWLWTRWEASPCVARKWWCTWLWTRLCGKKILVRASIGSWLPLAHSHANTKALSRCNPQLWNLEEINSFFLKMFVQPSCVSIISKWPNLAQFSFPSAFLWSGK